MRTTKFFLILLAAISMSFFTACNNDQSSAEEVKEDLQDAADETAYQIRQEREELTANLKELRNNIDDKIETLQADFADASAETKVEMNQQIEQLKAWGSKVDQELDRVGDNMSDDWKTVKSGVNEMMADIKAQWHQTFSNEG
ncbi:MAG: hypothetical protein KDC54_08210 [Lewinella sp.]|nr:hypothetical protein [Lewinella sp.]